MFVTGIAPSPKRLHERSDLPSGELVFLAKRALKFYRATHLLTSLNPGWEQALAKAAVELDLPIIVAVPYRGQGEGWSREARRTYEDLLSRAREVYNLKGEYSEDAGLDAHLWQMEKADTVLALWDYEFGGETFAVMKDALDCGKNVVNLWQDWEHLDKMRRRAPSNVTASRQSGARIYNSGD